MDVESALATWASLERSGHSLGWYRSQPWYRPELVGYRASAPVRTAEDLMLGERVGSIVISMADRDPIHADSLRYFYGAFPGAETFNKRERARLFHRAHGIPERDFYRIRGEAKKLVEGALLYG